MNNTILIKGTSSAKFNLDEAKIKELGIEYYEDFKSRIFEKETDIVKAYCKTRDMADKLLEDQWIVIDYTRCRVTKYQKKPHVIVCFKCADYGHKASDCKKADSLSNSFTIAKLNECINILNRKSAPRSDCVKNIQLYHLPDCGKELLLKIVNSSWNNNEILDIWKLARVTMIQKNTTEKSNPSNYRPISLTNSIIKIIERLDKFILYNNSISIF